MRLVKFGSYIFPEYDPDDPLDTAPSPRALQELPGGGAFDAVGTDTAPGRVRRLTKTFAVLEATATAQDTALDAIRALNGKRDLLWALMEDGTMRWTWAACEGVRYSKGKGQLAQVVQMAFMLPNPGWYGLYRGVWHLNGGEYLNAGLLLNQTPLQLTTNPQTVVLTNGGNRAVTAVKFRLTAAAANGALAGVWYQIIGYTDITFLHAIAVNEVVEIDGGAKLVTLQNVDHYSAITFGVSQRSDWITLQPGANSVIINLSAPGANLPTFEALYCEKWE
jgi:hypothetical protein